MQKKESFGIYGEKISLFFKNREIFKDISFFIPKNRITFILGKSGAGKTILSQIIVGLIQSQGNISIDSKPPQKKMITYIFQEPTLLDFLTLEENIVLPIKKIDKNSEFLKKIHDFIDFFGLKELKQLYPNALTPIQQKIATVIRAIALNPQYIIFDEPTTGFDGKSTKKMFEVILEIYKIASITPIIISHDINYALLLADYILFLDAGELIFQNDKHMIHQCSHETVVKSLSQ